MDTLTADKLENGTEADNKQPANRFEVRRVRNTSVSDPTSNISVSKAPDPDLQTNVEIPETDSTENVNTSPETNTDNPSSVGNGKPANDDTKLNGILPSPERANSETVSPAGIRLGQAVAAPPKKSSLAQPHNSRPSRVRHVSINSNGDTATSLSEADPNSSITHDTYRKFDTTNLRTFGQNTHEAIPNLDFYRQTTNAPQYKRPTLEELHEEKVAYL